MRKGFFSFLRKSHPLPEGKEGGASGESTRGGEELYALLEDARRAENYLRHYAARKLNWPRLEECAGIIERLRRELMDA